MMVKSINVTVCLEFWSHKMFKTKPLLRRKFIFRLNRKLNDHRHILQFYGISLRQNYVVLGFEKCIGSLADYIVKDENKTLVPTRSKKQFVRLKFQWAREITDGLAFIHALKVVHRDLKPENILVWTILLCYYIIINIIIIIIIIIII